MSAEVILLPDTELLVRSFLVAQPEVLAITTTVVSELPATKTEFMVRVHQFNTLRKRGHARWLSTAVLQLEAYGGPKTTAHTLLETCLAVMEARMRGVHNLGVVTDVASYGVRYEPDTTFTTARPRWLAISEVTAHP